MTNKKKNKDDESIASDLGTYTTSKYKEQDI